jgi:hypothetical protein
LQAEKRGTEPKKAKTFKARSAVLSDMHSLAQDGKICKGFFQKTFTFPRKNHQIFAEPGISFGCEGENGRKTGAERATQTPPLKGAASEEAATYESPLAWEALIWRLVAIHGPRITKLEVLCAAALDRKHILC